MLLCDAVFHAPLANTRGMFECGQVIAMELNRSPGMCVRQARQNSNCAHSSRDPDKALHSLSLSVFVNRIVRVRCQ